VSFRISFLEGMRKGRRKRLRIVLFKMPDFTTVGKNSVCRLPSGCESVMNAVHSSQYSTENLIVKTYVVSSSVSYCKQGRRDDTTSCILHCQVWRRRSVCQFRVLQREESQAQDLSGSWPADRCLYEEFCIFSPRFLTCSPAPLPSPIKARAKNKM
jgi:hypothetical protein